MIQQLLKYKIMIFNNLQVSPIEQQTLYTPVNNTVKKINLKSNESEIIAHIVVSPNGVVMVAIDKAGYAVIFNLKGYFTIAEFNFKVPKGQLFSIAHQHGFIVYRSPSLYRTFQPFGLIKKYKNRHSSNITTIRFSPDSKFLLTAGNDNIVYMNNLFPIAEYVAISLQVYRYKIIGMHFSHDMKFVYTIDSGTNVYVWKWVTDYMTDGVQESTGQQEKKTGQSQGAKRVQQQHTQTGKLNFIRKPITKSHSKLLLLFRVLKEINQGRFILAKKLIILQPGEYLKRVSYNYRNGFLACAYSKGKFSIYKLLEDEQSYILNQKGFIHETQALSFNNHKLIATGTNDGKVKKWDKIRGTLIRNYNKNSLFSSSLDGSVNAYDIVKYKKYRKFKPDMQCQLTCLEIDQSEDIIFAGSFDPYEVFSWNVQTGNILQIVRGQTSPISAIKMAEEKLITASWDKTLKIHQVFARKLNVEILEHSSEITVIAVHPNKTQCAASTMKSEIYIWDVEGGNFVGIIDSEIQGGRSYFSKISADNDQSTKYIKSLQYSTCGNTFSVVENPNTS